MPIMIIVVRNIPICPASLYAFRDEYTQKGCANKLISNHRSGNLNEIAA